MNQSFKVPRRDGRRARILLFGALAIGWIPLGAGCPTAPVDGQGAVSENQLDQETTDEPQADVQQGVDLAREIEEADIVKFDNGFFYLANPYTGLRIIDARSMDAPTLAGGVALGGRGVELLVRDNRAFIVTSADIFDCAGRPIGSVGDQLTSVAAPDYTGSRLWVIDIADPAAPTLLAQLDLDGFVSQTRRVGDVIYLAGDFGEFGFFLPTPIAEQTQTADGSGSDSDAAVSNQDSDVEFGAFVTSVNIADPENVAIVQTENFAGSSLDVHTSSTAIYVIGDDFEFFDTTLVSYVDISDPNGQITLRDQFRVPGFVRNRFFVDAHENTFRIITERFVEPSFDSVVSIFTYDVSNPDGITRLADATIITNESLRAVRFDGPRGYAVTFLQVDPLFVLDLADPAAPLVAGELEVPGFSTHLVPLGDRLVGVGFDDTDGVRPSVALYDVSDPSAPSQLARIIIGEAGSFDTSSEATVDEKALKILSDVGLILLPFSSFDSTAGRYVDALQLIGFDGDTLTQRGTVEHRGLVRRAGVNDQRAWILSDLAFQTVDIDDLDAPQSLSSVELIAEQDLLDAGLAGCVATARVRGTRLGFAPVFNEGFFSGSDIFPAWLLAPLGLCLPTFLTMLAVSLGGMYLTSRRCSDRSQ